MHVQRGLGLGVATAASLLALNSALAQPITDSEKIDRLQRQTELLEQQIKALKSEIAQTRKKTERVETVQAAHAAQAAAQTPPPRDPKSPMIKAPALSDKVKITLGGFISADTVWRQRNMVNDIGTHVQSRFHIRSRRFTASANSTAPRGRRGCRCCVEANIDAQQKLAAMSRGIFWASEPVRTTPRPTVGRHVSGTATSPMTTTIGASTSSPARRGVS